MNEIQNYPTQDDFEKLFINNHYLDQIHVYLNRFNPIHVMKMAGQEIRHSNILAWLLDPSETHGLGERFLKSFLTEALQGEYQKGGLSALDMMQADLRNVEVLREWQNIDIFLLSRQNNFAIVIENKFNSKQHSGQLKKYIEKVRNTLKESQPTLKIKGIFLTLHSEDPEDLSYATIGYDAICEILPWVMRIEGSSLSTEVSVFIKHYIEALKEVTGMSDELKEMEKLAKSLYKQNRKILDFIWEHGTATEFNLALDELFGDEWQDKEVVILKKKKQKLKNLWNSSDRFSFLPYEWDKALGGYEQNEIWEGCENWWSGYPVICWIQLIRNEDSSGTLRLFAEVGPLENHAHRQELIQTIKYLAEKESLKQIGFQKGASDIGRKYSKFFKNNSQKINDVQDVEDIAEGMERLLNNFQDCFRIISVGLDQFYKSVHN